MKNKWITKNKIEIVKLSSGGCNVYLLKHDKEYIIVDSGKRYYLRKIIKAIDKETGGTSPGFLILTHTHFDHAENAAALQKHYKLKIITDEKEKDYLIKGYTPIPKGTTLATRFIF